MCVCVCVCACACACACVCVCVCAGRSSFEILIVKRGSSCAFFSVSHFRLA